MPRTINISGVITSAETDHDYFGHWIDTGVITPESRVTKAIREAQDAGDSIVVKVNSYGGDVVAGGTMLNAILDFAREGDARVEIGAFAASMAANIVVQAARAGIPTFAHPNSIVLFHSARSVDFEGGPEAHKDEAKLLNQMNQPIKDALIQFGVPEARVTEGFHEGRQYTMSAGELKAHGIVSEIIGGSEPLPARPTDNTDDVEALHLAAYIEDVPVAEADPEKDDEDKEPEDKPEDEKSDDSNDQPEDEPEDKPDEDKSEEDEPEDEPDPDADDENAKALYVQQALDHQAEEFGRRLSGLQAVKDREIADLQKQLSNAAEARDEALAQCKQLQAQAENAKQELADLREQLDKANERQRRLTGGALKDTPDAMDKETARKLFAATPVSKRAEFYSKHKNLL